ncbi:MAG: hypothetical protein J0I17_06815 ['Candidatus Kapabacteria' thiocyanatum]|uniref:Uncharacterized protein n=1 Tax=Candidatus Kapaibacterium thiocyanatum TaxID=1895771 RepID=A0A1M3L6T0_9BACT|nr:hypothetical protein ['Candidatus Kapabacteria' thiocyanatum]OJX61271.1 MAG: hypothetical protein BGO89_01445 ['Candidatus Kapabacteria' thiocyanatum]
MMRRTLLPLILIALHAVGCKEQPTGTAPTTLTEAKERWASSGITDYELDRRVVCYCIGAEDTVRCRIERDSAVSIINLTTGEAVEIKRRTPATVQDLFDIVEKAQDEAHMLNVTYDATYGYPREINIDWSNTIADDEIFYHTIRLQPHF